jgi:hypothetical protein
MTAFWRQTGLLMLCGTPENLPYLLISQFEFWNSPVCVCVCVCVCVYVLRQLQKPNSLEDSKNTFSSSLQPRNILLIRITCEALKTHALQDHLEATETEALGILPGHLYFIKTFLVPLKCVVIFHSHWYNSTTDFPPRSMANHWQFEVG